MYLSPYFSKHASVKQGFQELIELFSWRDIKGADGRLMKVPPEATTYTAVIDIIRQMRDGIKPKKDGPASKEEIEGACQEFVALLKKGHLETPLLGSWAGLLDSQPQAHVQSKKRSMVDEGD